MWVWACVVYILQALHLLLSNTPLTSQSAIHFCSVVAVVVVRMQCVYVNPLDDYVLIYGLKS